MSWALAGQVIALHNEGEPFDSFSAASSYLHVMCLSAAVRLSSDTQRASQNRCLEAMVMFAHIPSQIYAEARRRHVMAGDVASCLFSAGPSSSPVPLPVDVSPAPRGSAQREEFRRCSHMLSPDAHRRSESANVRTKKPSVARRGIRVWCDLHSSSLSKNHQPVAASRASRQELRLPLKSHSAQN